MEYYHQVLGKIAINRRKNQKKIVLKYKPFLGIECSIPYYVSSKKAIKFIEKNGEWLKHQQNLYTTEFHRFLLKSTIQMVSKSIQFIPNSSKLSVEYNSISKLFVIRVPAFNPIKDIEQYSRLVEMIEFIIKNEAKIYLQNRISELAKEHRFEYNQLRIKNIRTRWGSCSSLNNINLNAHLVRLPKDLIDYVIVHELVHTIHKNHGKEFWNLLNEKMNGHAFVLDKELKNYNTSIFF